MGTIPFGPRQQAAKWKPALLSFRPSRYIGFIALAAVVGATWLFSDLWYGGALRGISKRAIAGPSITVVDGDTLRIGGESYRLVGLDTPETGRNAKCESERTCGEAATQRLREIVAGGSLNLERVSCACRSGSEGTSACNHGRLCGVLKAQGRDVAEILISEGLARRYNCGAASCPPRGSWCG